MRKIVSIILTLLIAVSCLTACSGTRIDDGKVSIIATIFPVYDWTREVIGDDDNFELSLLCDNGIDMHSFQPTAKDIASISTCDVFIYVGGESDEWVEEVLDSRVNEDMKIVNLIDVLGDLALPEGEDEPDEYDEHIWMSLLNAEYIVNYLAEEVLDDLSSDADKIHSNASNYASLLGELDSRYISAREIAAYDTFVVADRYPFRYLSSDYNLNYYAAFDGCSAETEASFETILFLASMLDEIGSSSIVVTEGSDSSIAHSVISASSSEDTNIYVLNSLQSVSGSDISNGTTYISLMEENLEVLSLAIGSGN